MTICTRCAASWSGLRTAHCTNCHQTFLDGEAFDAHRGGPAAGRRCVSPQMVGLADANRAYPCWTIPAGKAA